MGRTINEKIKDKREGSNPNIKGEKAVNVKTDQENAANVPATEQKDISPKARKEDNSNNG